ncbi:MAG: hypothetical protein M3406_08385 [Chloroflexota bacterium]|nr:hypothetical protein [Chloroflexota bacterium]
MRRKILPFILGGALSIAAIAPASAATNCNVTNRGGAAALVALVNANVGAGVNVCQIDVDILNNSLNNLLQNADVDVLSNILNNSPILNDSLNNLTINVVDNDILNGIQINVLGGGLNLTITDPPA